MSLAQRLTGYATASRSLSLLDDRQLKHLLDGAEAVGAGIGGETARLTIDGVEVFAKKVPLTAQETNAANLRSTANIFELPANYHYGIGSAGFGAWREVAAHIMTTNWVLTHQSENFPLMYHWRVLPEPFPLSMPEELADIEHAVDYWEGSPAVRARLEAIERRGASVVLLLEYVPQTLQDWLTRQLTEGGDAAESAIAMVDRELDKGVSFMNSKGLLHFDNILTDGERLYFSDFGLAMSNRFELSAEESAFFDRHLSYDRSYTQTYLARWLIKSIYGYSATESAAFLRECAASNTPAGIPSSAATVFQRSAPVSLLMIDFYRQLQNESRTTPYPSEEVRRVLAPS